MASHYRDVYPRLHLMKKGELQKELGHRGCSTAGTKKVLMTRLEEELKKERLIEEKDKIEQERKEREAAEDAEIAQGEMAAKEAGITRQIEEQERLEMERYKEMNEAKKREDDKLEATLSKERRKNYKRRMKYLKSQEKYTMHFETEEMKKEDKLSKIFSNLDNRRRNFENLKKQYKKYQQREAKRMAKLKEMTTKAKEEGLEYEGGYLRTSQRWKTSEVYNISVHVHALCVFLCLCSSL